MPTSSSSTDHASSVFALTVNSVFYPIEYWTPLISLKAVEGVLTGATSRTILSIISNTNKFHQTVPCRAYYPDMYNGGEYIGAELLGRRKVFDDTDWTGLINVRQEGIPQLKSSYVCNEDPKDITTYALAFFTNQEPSPVLSGSQIRSIFQH